MCGVVARGVAALFLAALAVSAATRSIDARTLQTQHFTIEYDNLPDGTVQAVAQNAEQAFHDVTSFVGVDWSSGKIRLVVSDKYVLPYMSRQQRTLGVPPNRLSPTGAQTGPASIRGRAIPFWNALVHIIAPSGQNPREWGRFATEGLGIFLQSRFGGRSPTPWPAKYYPTMGEPPHAAAAELAAELGVLPLRDAVARMNDRRLTNARRLGWLEAGSFVQYLIDTRGRDRFTRWYLGGAFEKSYGTSMEDIAREWSAFLRQLMPS
jgi:hypothetical protein